MTLDHFGKPISTYLYQCFGFFSAAEGFFFLSGFVGMLAASSKSAKDPGQSWMRWRALKTWRYHAVTLLALCAAAYFFLPQVGHFFKGIYQHPVQGILLSAALVNTPEWLDVLPLYVIFLLIGSFIFPHFVKAKSMGTVFLLWLPSLAVWIAAQFGLRDACNSLFPAWVEHGFFDPFGWQFVYFTGAAVAAWWKRAKTATTVQSVSADATAATIPQRQDVAKAENCAAAIPQTETRESRAVRTVKAITPAVLVALAFCFVWSHQFIPVQLPSEALVSKDHVGALRFANFFMFVLAICWIVRRWPPLLDFRPTNLLGRHSLDVYTAHIVFIYIWMSMPNSVRYHGPWNVLAPVATCALLWCIAKAREPRAVPISGAISSANKRSVKKLSTPINAASTSAAPTKDKTKQA